MKAMALAAGKGTRLFPLTGEIPKPMAPVVNTPIIEHIFDLLAVQGIEEVYVNVHYLADALLNAYGEESKVYGMAVHLERGDALTDVNIKELVEYHREKDALATIALRRVYDTSEFGVVEIDEEGDIQGFQEKPRPEEAISTLANTGIYVFEPRALDYIPEGTFFDFAEDVFPKLLENGERFVGYQEDFYWSDIGTLGAYRQAQYDVLSGKAGVTIPGEKQGEGLWVGEDAQIHSAAEIEGHVLIGKDAVVGRGVKLLGDVTVGSDCWIRPNVTIKRSILLPGASVG